MLRISADFDDLDLALIHGFLSGESYWAAGIPLETLERALRNSICCSGHLDGRQVAFGRVITDQATFAYLADVFVLPQHRGCGYGRAIVEALMADQRLQGLRRWHLVTRDMQPLYACRSTIRMSIAHRDANDRSPAVLARCRACCGMGCSA
jgi:GNAT superfamily N-acetyltransferase